MDQAAGYIALFAPDVTGGGAERVLLNLGRAFVQRGFKVDLVLAQARGAYLREIPSGIQVVDLAVPNVLLGLYGLIRYLRRARPGLLFSALDHANLVALWACLLAGAPTRCFVSVHSLLSLSWSRSQNPLARCIPFLASCFYPEAETVIAVSRAVAEDLKSVTGLSADKIKVIYNPVVTPEIPVLAAARPDHPWLRSKDKPVILAAGRLTAAKDFATLIQSFRLLKQKLDCRLIILGEGPERGNIEALITEQGLGDAVSMPGFVANPFAFMRQSSVFVLSSAWEGFGNVLVEAMACGCPVVSTQCPGGPAEILENGKYGPLVRVGDVEELMKAILAVLGNPPAAEVLRERAAMFTLEVIAQQYIQMLTEIGHSQISRKETRYVGN